MPIQILIGLKRLRDAKTRLGPDVPAPQRRELMLEMLRTVVAAAVASGLGPVALVTSEPEAPRLADRWSVAAVSDADLPWNQGLVHALRSVSPPPASVLFLAGDLPLLRPVDLLDLVAAAPPRGACIARARDGGSNALLLTPADALVPSFGTPRSARVHAQMADQRGLACVTVDIPGLALDVDTVADARDAGLLAPLSGRDRATDRG